MERHTHWNQVYTTKGERDVSWFEALPAISLAMLEAAGMTTESCVLDVGGGDSHLVDALAERGLDCLAVLDISGAALERARTRMGSAAQVPVWIEADVTSDWTLKPMDIWHDRAVFHFLTTPEDRARYKRHLLDTLKPGGAAVVATFAPDGPERCSGLPVQRYSPEQLAVELGSAFELRDARACPYDALGKQAVLPVLAPASPGVANTRRTTLVRWRWSATPHASAASAADRTPGARWRGQPARDDAPRRDQCPSTL